MGPGWQREGPEPVPWLLLGSSWEARLCQNSHPAAGTHSQRTLAGGWPKTCPGKWPLYRFRPKLTTTPLLLDPAGAPSSP